MLESCPCTAITLAMDSPILYLLKNDQICILKKTLIFVYENI